MPSSLRNIFSYAIPDSTKLVSGSNLGAPQCHFKINDPHSRLHQPDVGQLSLRPQSRGHIVMF